MKEYKCYTCQTVFEAEGTQKDFKDPVYGPCTKWVAECPTCGGEAGQLVKNPAKSKGSAGPSCGNYDCCSSCGLG